MSDTAAATRSLRRRLTVIATIAVAVLLAATATLLLGLQRRQLVDDVDERLGERADGLSAMLADRASSIAAEPADEDRAVQVVDAAGDVVVASANLAGSPAVADPPEGRQVIRTVDRFPADDGDFRLLSRRVDAGDDDAMILHVAESIDDIDENVRVLAGSLLLAFPVVLAALAALTWWLVGRTLRPVEAAAARQERFVADASHELRSPLARIRTRLEVDLAHPEGADLHDSAGDVLAEARGMEHLVDDLLHLARADADPRRNRRDDPLVGLDDVVLAEAAAARDTSGVAIDTSGVSGATVHGRSDDLARLVRNLLDNAVAHAAGHVRMTLSTTGRDAVLVVDDDGDGIPPAQRAHVFERFGRLDEARASGGTGLGLAIALEIARSHGGTIDVGDAPMGGARFVAVLPAA